MRTSITVVLDRSGSMASVRDDAIGGFNTFLEKERQAGDGTRMTLTRFDHEYEIICVDRPVADVEPLNEATYVPRGSTALNDAVGRTIAELDARLDRTPEAERPERVLFVILTDGLENASREFTTEQVRDMIARHERARGWTFVYLSADLSAFAEADRLGIAQDRAFAFAKTARGTGRTFEVLSTRVREYKDGREFAFTDEDRGKA